MTSTTATATPAASPRPARPEKSVLGRLASCASDLIGRIEAAITQQITRYLPTKIARSVVRNPATALKRMEYTYDLVIALARTMAGDLKYLRSYATPRKPVADNTPTKPKPSRKYTYRPPTEASRDAAYDRRLRHTLLTQPIHKIARRIASTLAIHKESDSYPRDLLKLTQTPAEYGAKRRSAAPEPQPDKVRGFAPEPPSGSTDPEPHDSGATPPDPHKRE